MSDDGRSHIEDFLREIERVRARLDAQEKSYDTMAREVREAIEQFRAQAIQHRKDLSHDLASRLDDVHVKLRDVSDTIEETVESLSSSVEAVLISMETDRRLREQAADQIAQRSDRWRDTVQRVFDSKPVQYAIVAIIAIAASYLGLNLEALGISAGSGDVSDANEE